MIFHAHGGYAPDEPEGSQKSDYMSRKDFVRIVVIMAIVLALLYPVYTKIREDSYTTICRRNLGAIMSAMNQYAEVHSGRFPPVFDEDPAGAPIIIPSSGQDAASTWVSKVAPYMGSGVSFHCPAARRSDEAWSIDTVSLGEAIPSTYGMYFPLGVLDGSYLASPSTTIIIAETSNFGANDTYNPVPFIDVGGNEVRMDGFSIGYNDNNYVADPETSETVTRLAIYNSAGGDYGATDAFSRHPVGVLVLYADGHTGVMSKNEAYLRWTGSQLEPPWEIY